jgi:Tol biopolymer transport system component/DNA-binding winged helix-turn-helix (wHTH) protein
VKVLDRSPRLVRFEGFQLDLRAGELRPDAGKTLRLSEQPFRILIMLLERPGEVLTREDIRKELWPDNTIVEFEHSINAAMNRLRQALGDSGDDPHYIETLARRGYRWMVSVEGMEVGVGPTSDVKPRHWWRWAAALVAVMGLGGGILWFVRPTPKTTEPRLTVTPLTASPDPEGDPSFSPDGNQVAFGREGKSHSESHIYVKLIGTGGPPLRITTGSASDHSPAWSPDGRYIAFLRRLSSGQKSGQKSAVLLIPALGGPERKIAEVFPSGYLNCTDLTWLPDGNSLVISDRNSPKEPTGLFLLAIDTGEKRRLTSPPFPAISSWNGDNCPSLSPDGRTLAFSRRVDVSGDLYLLAVSNDLTVMGEAKPIELGNHSADAPVWTEDGREIIFWDSTQQSGLWRIDVSGSASRSKEPQPIVALGENASSPSISRRGHRLAYTSSSDHSSIWRIAAPDGSKTREEKSAGSVNGDTPFINSTRDDSAPEFSPDGKRIEFTSNRSGDWQIWVCDSDGSNPVQLTSFRGLNSTNPRWSPDGGRIAFDSDAEGKQYDIWVINANGGKPKRMTTDPANDGNPSWSGDGRWIYFDSARTGEQQVWKIPEAGGDAIQVTRDGGYAPLESPDGKFIYYTKGLINTSLWRLPVEGGQATKLIENLSFLRNLVIVSKGIYFVPQQGPALGSSIEFLDFATNYTKRVASFEKSLSIGGLSLSPDGQWMLYSEVDQVGSELRLVENFH